MRGAQQPAAGIVEKTVGLVVHLHGDMGAAVQVGMGPALVADRKGPAGLPRGPRQRARRRPCRRSRRWSTGYPINAMARQPSGVVRSQSCSSATECTTAPRAQRMEGVGLVGAVTHAHAGAAGVQRHLQVVRGVADHQRALGGTPNSRHQFLQHAGVRACRRSRRPCGSRQTCPQLHRMQRVVQPAPALAVATASQCWRALQSASMGSTPSNRLRSFGAAR
jgi:hypothetical protein